MGDTDAFRFPMLLSRLFNQLLILPDKTFILSWSSLFEANLESLFMQLFNDQVYRCICKPMGGVRAQLHGAAAQGLKDKHKLAFDHMVLFLLILNLALELLSVVLRLLSLLIEKLAEFFVHLG